MLPHKILEDLFRQNYSQMILLANSLIGKEEEAEDIVQDIFLRVAESDIAPRNNSYLLSAVRNACLNRIRQMQVHDKIKNLLPIEETDLQPIDQQIVLLGDINTFVDEHLKEPHRSIFHLRFDDDLTIAEIACQLNLNPNTTYKYLMQIIQKIRDQFNS